MSQFVYVVRFKDYDGTVHGIIEVCKTVELAEKVISDIKVILTKHEIRREFVIEWYELIGSENDEDPEKNARRLANQYLYGTKRT